MRCSVTTGGHRHRHLCKGAAYENDSNSCSCCLNQPVPSAKRVARAMTDPSATMDGKSIDADGVENDPKSPKKIQFEMPSFQTYLDPASSEQIRRRRPTPASLILLSDQSSPEEEQTSCVTGINYLAQTSQPRPLSVFNPPTRKGPKQEGAVVVHFFFSGRPAFIFFFSGGAAALEPASSCPGIPQEGLS
ncbi:uncharacterized protein LOC116948749 isoform X8 [Petromyzon marinus]|uniref:uncharacterized protein LOC116948749 isoform X8 n=1 Tax=Petromyzon marinus TaxID=7757 RepID=UPI003F72B2BA